MLAATFYTSRPSLTVTELMYNPLRATPDEDPLGQFTSSDMEFIELRYDGPSDPPLDASARICLYRFLQETLSNAARHAPGAPVHVAVTARRDAVTARVRDEGPGFDPTAIVLRPDGGEGLAGLRDRAESIGGDLDIDAQPGKGTTLVLRLPLGRGESE